MKQALRPRPTREVSDDAAPRSPALVVNGLAKSYGDHPAVRDLSLEVPEGGIVGLLGPNGAGKTTTIAAIAGLLRPDRGEIVACGVDVLDAPRSAHPFLGVAAQEIALYPGLTVGRNLRFFGSLHAVPDLERSVAELVERLGLGPIADRRVMDLSIGQQRLAHVACALVHRPKLLLLDEPTAGLDVAARAALHQTLAALVAEGTGVLFSSHYLGEVEDLCDRVVIIHRGSVIASGTVEELIARHGGGRVELTIDGDVVVHDGIDVAHAISSVPRGARLGAVKVIPPSLQAVFLTLTGLDSTDAEATA